MGLTRVYQRLVLDPRLSESETLQKHRIRVRGRLTKVREEIQRQSKHDIRGNAPNQQSARSRGGRAIPDYGPRLVALIERTIAPDSWDVHGGSGTIVYYRPLRVLVVQATSTVTSVVSSMD